MGSINDCFPKPYPSYRPTNAGENQDGGARDSAITQEYKLIKCDLTALLKATTHMQTSVMV